MMFQKTIIGQKLLHESSNFMNYLKNLQKVCQNLIAIIFFPKYRASISKQLKNLHEIVLDLAEEKLLIKIPSW